MTDDEIAARYGARLIERDGGVYFELMHPIAIVDDDDIDALATRKKLDVGWTAGMNGEIS